MRRVVLGVHTWPRFPVTLRLSQLLFVISFGPNQQNYACLCFQLNILSFLANHSERKATEDFKAFSWPLKRGGRLFRGIMIGILQAT